MIRRRILTGLLLACLSSFSHAKGDRQNFKVYDFSKGLDTYHNPSSLPDGFVQDAQNVLFDAQAPVQKRAGFTYSWGTKAYSYTGLWTYNDQTNTTWQIARSSDQITASNLAGSVVVVATVSANNVVGEANAFGNAYFVDQTQGVYYWNGSVTVYVSSSPLGSIITQFHNRLWVTGAAVPNGNQLYGSGYYSGTSWTTGPLATDPVQYSIGLQDNFDNVTAEYVYLDTLYLFKHYAISALYGFDQTSFLISNLTQECGCIDGGSIQTFNGGLKFVSLRGVEDFNGYTCKRISDPVKDKLDPAISISAYNSSSWIQTSQTDWQLGTMSPANSLSTTISPGDVVVSSFGATDTFSSGTFNNTFIYNGGVVLSTSDANVANNSFDSLTGGIPDNWTSSGFVATANQDSSGSCGAKIFPKDGSFFVESNVVLSPPSSTLTLLDKNGNALATISIPFSTCTGWYQAGFISGTIPPRTYVQLRLTSGSDLITSNFFLTSGVYPHVWANAIQVTPGFYRMAFDLEELGASSISSGTYTSPAFNLGLATPTYTLIQPSYTTADFAPAFSIQTATSASGSWKDLSQDINGGKSFNTYARYISTFTSGAGDMLTSLNSVPIVSRDTGTFTSQSHNISTVTAFGNFSATTDLSSGGNIAFSVCTANNAAMTGKKCASQALNSQVSVSTNIYVQVIASFTITAATNSPTFSDVVIQSFSGTRAPPMVSTIWDNRYWLGLTTSTADSSNDAVIVLNTRGAWSDLNIHAGAFTQYKNGLYHADSNPTGNVYLDNQGFSDNGSAINAYVKTKDESLGDVAADDYLYVVYPSASNTGSCAMSVQYDMDHSGNIMSLGSPLLSEFSSRRGVRLPFPIDSTHQLFGQSVNFTFGTNDASCDFQFFGAEMLFKTRPIQ